ncbi:hypothetical protein niasHT_028524 [Heterodera trifolii]|uniref:C2H2-type domain-containing protein n=1 Tax=Heterodera trifolii TaxID=157864 RepID=A0ABD2KPV4_9BILA
MFFKFVCELLRDGQPCLQEFTTTTKRMVRQRRAHSAAERMVPYVCNYCSGCSFYEQNFRRHMVHSHPALSTHPPLHGGAPVGIRAYIVPNNPMPGLSFEGFFAQESIFAIENALQLAQNIYLASHAEQANIHTSHLHCAFRVRDNGAFNCSGGFCFFLLACHAACAPS